MSTVHHPTPSIQLPLIVITGPTASGKTGLALDLAERYGGEIICADSRTIYEGMDIGTAKPTPDEQARVPHHLLDVVQPGERYTAADFQAAAYRAISDIRMRGKVPFLVGGTGLYIDAVVLDFQWPERRQDPGDFDTYSDDELRVMIKKQQLGMPQNSMNRRHLVNALVRGASTGKSRRLPLENTNVVAISTDRLVLAERIQARAEQMFGAGVVEETVALASRYGWDNEAMSSNIYPIIRRMQGGELSRSEAIEQLANRDKQLAKRQVTWLRRHDYVRWLALDEARTYIETILE